MKKKNSAAAAPPAGPNLFGEAPPPAPAKKDGLLAFSYSKMSLYEECPLKYKFKYIDKIKEEPKFYFAFGSAIHAALEFLYSVRNPPFPTLDEVCEAFRREWNLKSYLEKGYRTQQKSDDDYQKGLLMLKAYYEHNRARFAPPFLVEYATDVEVDGLLVRTISDRIEHLGGGEITIIDYKTGKDVRREPAQLYMYQKITELDPRLKEKIAETYGTRVNSVRIRELLYYHVPSNKEYTFARADDKEIGNFWERVLGVADSIRGLKFDPTPAERACSWCDYKALCPAFFGGHRHAPQPQFTAPGNIEVLVDRYGRLKEKMQEIQAELDKVAEDIGRSAKSGGEYAGNAFTASVSKSQKWAFPNREAVLGVLNQFDLYQKALDVTVAGLGRLLDSPDLAPDARQKLLEQAVRKTAVDIKIVKKGE
ncbi:MAG: PD-(D/E)XK nuclease family protein [Elusimicrobiales bacterium]|nr:PD-(D/E)XK nuclease family protein [Elusimicrobiales bacterium]